MAFIRTVLIILALLLGWTALRHQGIAGNAPARSMPAAAALVVPSPPVAPSTLPAAP